MKRCRYIYLPVLFSAIFSLPAPAQGSYIHSREGNRVMDRKQLVNNCLRSLNKDKSDKTASAICECQVSKIDRHFTMKEYRKNTRSGVIDINGLLKEDSLIEKQIQDCFTASGKTLLLQAEGFESEFIANCRDAVQKATEKQLDPDRLTSYCNCRLNLVREKKLTDAEAESLADPNSVLFYEVMYKCGDPFATADNDNTGWTEHTAQDVHGPASDTVAILTLNGMSYIRLTIGSQQQVWLFDTGASDLLINTDTEAALKKEGILNSGNYLGTGEYEMANGAIDTCRKYRISHVHIGGYSLDNIGIAVTEKGKRIIAGKNLLNKFSSWILDNRKNQLVLHK
jgi:hypothetical protein